MTESIHAKGGPRSERKGGNKVSKRAVLHELNSHMQVRAAKMRMITRGPKDLSEEMLNQSEIQHRGQGEQAPRPKAKSTYQTKKYNPSYTWNRGGRVKELKIRTIARKFLFLWVRKTFGRVKPSTARSHFQKRLVQECFREWHEQWWISRKEWGLGVRAELHYRYHMWSVVWAAWRQYTLCQRVKTKRKRIADKHGNAVLRKKILQNWLVYVNERKTKKAVASDAHQLYLQRLTRAYWHKWKLEYERRKRQHEEEDNALHVWAHNVQAKAWTIWYNQWILKNQERYKEKQAKLKAEETLLERCIESWKKYLSERRRKKNSAALADKARRHFVLERCLGKWASRWEECHTLRVHQQRMVDLSRKFQCRQMLQRWKLYVEQRKYERQQELFAVDHHNLKLKRMCLSVLRLRVTQRKVKTMKISIAQDHYNTWLLKRHWSSWTLRMDEREEFWMAELTQKAKQHFRETTVKKSLLQWQRYLEWRKVRKHQYAVADAHYYVTVLPKCLLSWGQFVVSQIRKRELVEMGLNFERENLQGKYFYQWHNSFTSSQDHRMMERMAILHHNELLRKRTFSHWKERMEEALQLAFKQDIAREHWEVVLMRRHLGVWIQHVQETQNCRANELKAVRHNYLKRMQSLWNVWKAYTDRKRTKREKYQLAERHDNRVKTKRLFEAWIRFNASMKGVHDIANRKWTEKCLECERKYFALWKQGIREQKEEKKKLLIAVAFSQKSLKLKVLQQWHSYAIYRVRKLYERNLEVQEAVDELNKVKVSCAFMRWCEVYNRSVVARQADQKADAYHRKRLLLECVQTWKAHTQLKVRKQLLHRQCMWFHNTRITARFFYQWKVSLQNHREMTRKTHSALWHWSLTLQRKVLLNWLLNAHERMRKKRRYGIAMEKHRMYLLRQGATQWLTVANDMVNIRQKIATQQGAQCALKTWQTVRRCAEHWRSWTRRRRSTRPVQNTRSAFSVVKENPVSSKNPALPRDTFDRPTVSEDSPVRSVTRKVGFHETSERRVQQVALRPKPKMPSFLVDSLKKDGLYVSQSGHALPLPVRLTAPPEQNVDVQSPVSTATVNPIPILCHDLDAQTELKGETRAEPAWFDKNTDLRIFLPGPEVAVSRTREPDREAEKNETITLLPPSAFLVKRDGTPIVDAADPSEPKQTTLNGDVPFLSHSGKYLVDTVRSVSQDIPHEFISPAEEIIHIRKQLQDFKAMKQKYRRAVEQEKQLSSWLNEQATDSDDPDVTVIREELQQIKAEVAEFSHQMMTQKSLAQQLTARAQDLLQTLSS